MENAKIPATKKCLFYLKEFCIITLRSTRKAYHRNGWWISSPWPRTASGIENEGGTDFLPMGPMGVTKKCHVCI